MRVRPKVSPYRVGRRRNVRQTNVATIAIACIVLALAVDVLTPGDNGATPAAAVERPAPEARVDKAFVAVRQTPLAEAPLAAPHTQSRCGDFDFSFLNASCSTAWKKHPARLHRPATFVAGVANAALLSPQMPTTPQPKSQPKSASAQPGPAKPPALAAITPPDRAPPPVKKLKPAVTAGLAAAIQ